MGFRTGTRMTVAAAFIAAAFTWIGVSHAEPDAVVDRGATLNRLESLLDELGQIEDLNERNQNRFSRKRIDERVRAMRAEIRTLRRDLENAPGVGDVAPPTTPTPVEPPVAAPEPMSAPEFQRFLSEVKKASFSQGKLEVVKDVAARHYFTTEQIIATMKVISFSDAKVETAAAMHPHVVDPQNFYQVYSQLPFEEDKQALRTRIGE